MSDYNDAKEIAEIVRRLTGVDLEAGDTWETVYQKLLKAWKIVDQKLREKSDETPI